MAPLLLVLLLQSPTAAPAPRLRLPAVSFVLAQAADAGSSCYAFQTGRFVEANGLLSSNCARVTITKAAYTGLVVWTHAKLSKNHPKAARVSLWIATGLSVVPLAWNLHALTR
jgi:hypothetical protein